MRRGKYLSALIIVGALSCQNAMSTDIYRWVDDEGIVHFSDTQPNSDTDVKTLQVNASNPPDYDPANDPYSIANQAKRMNDKWTELAKEREVREEKRRESARQYAQYQPPRYDGWRYNHWPGYYAPVRPVRPPPNRYPAIRRQANALSSLELTGPRPHSINSGAHNARVESSNNFLQAVSRPVPRPTPR